MAASVRPAMPLNHSGVAGPSGSSSSPPSPTTVRHISPSHISPTRPASGINFGGAFLRPSSSMSRPNRPNITIINHAHSDTALERQHSAPMSDREGRGSWSVPSSGSGSKASSFISTPRLLSRRGSAREREWPRHDPPTSARSNSVKGKAREDQPHSAISETDAFEPEVIETPQLRVDRDPETGKKMINQYMVLEEIGHGTHGRVRLGKDTLAEPDDEHDFATGSGALYAIKIVERNPKKKRLNGLGRKKPDGAKRVAENEIRKEIAIFKKVHHPNVVRMKEIIDDPESSKLYMVLEYCEGGEVQWKVGTGQPALTLAETRHIFRDTLLGLEYLHHQGIIHRDIKPSNLLRSGDLVKISDFGCSHYSEALLAAQGGDETYVDDIELAKTAGSPAFFAPEMCYSEDDIIATPATPPASLSPEKVPTFTVRPPSAVSDKSLPFSPIPEQPLFDRSMSTSTIAKKPRHPITNAIDVWALGVTFYCLLFGRTPFDAANEYLLMQAIPTAQYPIPPTMSRDALPTSGSSEPDEVREALDLLSRLLEKDAMKRIPLEQAKRHPFVLRGMPDAQEWLQTTDPRKQTSVTVTKDEVDAAVTHKTLRQHLKRGFQSLSKRIKSLGVRGRSQSVTTDSDINDHSGSSGADAPSRKGDGVQSAISGPTLARKLSQITRDRSRGSQGAHGHESPRPGLLPSSPPRLPSPAVFDRRESVSGTSADSTPRQLPSMASIEKIRHETSASPGRRRLSNVDPEQRPRSSSNASSSGSIFSALGRGIFTRENSRRGSHRSNGHPIKSGTSFGSTDEMLGTSMESHTPVFSSSVQEHGAEFLVRRSTDDIARRQSMDTFESGSPGSMNGHFNAPSPDRLHSWESRFGPGRGNILRRGSTLSEDIRPVMEDEEVDWEGNVPDSDEECAESDDDLDGLPPGHGIHSAPADWNLAAALEGIEKKQARLSPGNSPIRAQSLLRASGGLDLGRLSNASPTPGHTPHTSSNLAQPPLAQRVPPSAYRAKSPLGDPHYSIGAEPCNPDRFQDADDDDGLVLGPRRGRKGSTLSRQGSQMSRQSSNVGTSPQ